MVFIKARMSHRGFAKRIIKKPARILVKRCLIALKSKGVVSALIN